MAAILESDALLSPEQAAQLLGVKRETLAIWRCCRRYNLPWCKIGRSVKYRRADIERFIEARTVGAISG